MYAPPQSREPQETPAVPKTVVEDLKPRIEAAAAAVADSRMKYRLDVKTLKRLVVQAVDERVSQREIAKWAGYKSTSRVTQILAEPDDE
jgi:hypothetical protein